tara:strand:- start:270 stop:485 length:216 start_codon:yes stop_codon:yes gene_type:complete
MADKNQEYEPQLSPKSMMQYAQADEPSKFAAAANEILLAKAADALEVKRTEIASNFLKQPDVEYEEEDDGE